jgi:hypothetical protein
LPIAGVRGSTPVSGTQFDRVGGRTSCVAVRRDRDALPTLILDAGTGITNLAAPFEGALLVGTIILTPSACACSTSCSAHQRCVSPTGSAGAPNNEPATALARGATFAFGCSLTRVR